MGTSIAVRRPLTTATTTFPSLRLRSSSHQFQLFLVALLVAEVLYLTIVFDAAQLLRASSLWTIAVSWSPHYLRLAITITFVVLFVGGTRFVSLSDGRSSGGRVARLAYLTVHGFALLAFIRLTTIVFAREATAVAHPAFWGLAWFLTGGAALLSWALAFSPALTWLEAASQKRLVLAWAVAVAALAWSSGYLTEPLWTPLARYTFNVVSWMLAFVYPTIISDPSRLIIGTPSFKVMISPQCSGYEGVGLILAFLTTYLWVFRRDLRFPSALALLPLGAVAIWILNAVRVAALIIIGSSGWPTIALGGFHSQAGWLAFNAVGLGFVAIMNRQQYFMATSSYASSHDERKVDPTTAFLGPFVVIIAIAMVTAIFATGIDWLYPVRVVGAGVVLWLCRTCYSDLTWTLSWRAIGIGFVTFAIWLALVPEGSTVNDTWPAALRSTSMLWAAAWLFVRVIGYVVAVPVVEELAFRGYLTRRLIQADFERLPIGIFTWSSFVISSVVFGAFHGQFWMAGTVAGMAYAFALYRRGALGDAVQAHATTNGLIAVYVLATGHWSVWS